MAGQVNSMQSYQDAANQLLQINAQRKSNLAEAKAEDAIEATRNGTLAQAAEFISTQPQENQYVDAALNPATQNVLGQYGLGQPKIQKTSTSSQQVTKQNIIINNKNTTITNNDVKVPGGIGGPVQSRPVQFQDPNQVRFKTWLANSFAQQNEMAEKRRREYDKRDSALERNSNKLIRKLEETGKVISTNLNPKNMASSVGNQLKTLLFVLGFAAIAKNWPTIMNNIDDISKKVGEIKDNVVSFFSEGGGLVKLFGGKDDESVLQAFKNLFLDKNDGILAYVKKWLNDRSEERSAAIKNIPKPDLSIWDPGKSISEIVDYLSSILRVIANPSKSAEIAVKKTANNYSKEYQENNSGALREGHRITVKDKDGNEKRIKVSGGEAAVASGNYRGLMPNALDNSGNLIGTAGSTYSQGAEIERALENSKKGNIQTSVVTTGLNRLSYTASKNGSVVVGESFLKSLIGEEGIKELGLVPTKYSIIIRPKTQEELAFDNKAINDKYGFSVGNAARMAGEVNFGGGLGKAAAISEGLYRVSAKSIANNNNPLYTTEIREGENPDISSEEFRTGKNFDAYKLTKEDLQKVINKFTGSENSTPDLTNENFIKSIEDKLISNVGDKYKNSIIHDININSLYEPNRLKEQHEKEEEEMRKNSRVASGAHYVKESVNNIADKLKVPRIFKFERVNPSNIDSGDLSGVVAAANRGVFYSDDSARERKGGNVEGTSMSKNGYGYIPLGKDLNGFMHKCTSGPATFYHDGTEQHIQLNGNWWNTGSPKNATGTNLGRVGFQPIWNGTAAEGWSTESLLSNGVDLHDGDIMLNFGINKSGNPSSHAAMYVNGNWISDTNQGHRAFVYRRGRLEDYSAQIWRYDKNKKISDVAAENLASVESEQQGAVGADDIDDLVINGKPDENNQTVELEGVEYTENPQEAVDYSELSSIHADTEGNAIYTYNGRYGSYTRDSSGRVRRTFNFGSNISSNGAHYVPTSNVSFTPESSLASDHPVGEKSSEVARSTDEKEKQQQQNFDNMIASSNTTNANLEAIQQILVAESEISTGTLNAVNGVIAAVEKIPAKNNTPSTPPAPYYTLGYNSNPVS